MPSSPNSAAPPLAGVASPARSLCAAPRAGLCTAAPELEFGCAENLDGVRRLRLFGSENDRAAGQQIAHAVRVDVEPVLEDGDPIGGVERTGVESGLDVADAERWCVDQ